MRRLALVVLAACSSTPAVHAPPPPPRTSGKPVATGAAHAVTSEDISLTVGTRTIPGTIIAPSDPGPWPGVVMLAGSGPTDRDWNSKLLPAKNGSGKLLAEQLAAHGAVVIRFDKAGSGANPGPPLPEWTIDTYRDEAVAALNALRGRADVRKDKVFIAGHSEGGIHATRLALSVPGEIAGIIYLSSASRSMADTILTQLEGNLRNPLAGLSEAQIQAELTSLRTAFTDFLAGKPVDPATASTLPPLQKLVAGIVSPQVATLSRPLFGFDNAKEAPALTVPVLIINGGKDLQVDPVLDGQRLYDAFLAAKRDATRHVAPDADHVLKHEPKTVADLRANMKATQDAYNAEGRVLDPDLAQAVVAWLAVHT